MKQMTNLLGLYGGCDTDELKRIRKLPSRWVCLSTTFPSLVIYEGGCYLLHDDKDPSKLVPAKRQRTEGSVSNGVEEKNEESEEDKFGY
jgi:hypothetical protein